MKKAISSLIKLAKYAGGRFDLVQAGGGNVGVKIDTENMLVTQAWGITLTETNENVGYAHVNTASVADILSDTRVLRADSLTDKNITANELLRSSNYTPHIKPTAEVYLHALMPFKYTLHLHPTAINCLLIIDNPQTWIQSSFPTAGFIDYATPGLEVSLLFNDYFSSLPANKLPHLVFMKNHGLMIGDDNMEQLISHVETLIDKAEKLSGINNQRYRYTTKIASLFNQLQQTHQHIAYLSEDQWINQIYAENKPVFFSRPVYPDQFIYNGLMPCVLDELSTAELLAYQSRHEALPKVVIYKDHIYFIARHIPFAKEMEDVFKSHLHILLHCNQATILNDAQIKKIRF